MFIFNLRATAFLAVNQHPVRVLVALTCLGPVWAVTLMSSTISTQLTNDCRFRVHWRPWGCFGCCCYYEEKCFFQHFFFKLNFVLGFPLEFFNPVIQTQKESRIPHPASRNPHGYYGYSAFPAIKQHVLIGKKTTLHMHQAFSHISLPSLHDCKVKIHNFTFCRGQEHNNFLFLFPNFDTIL